MMNQNESNKKIGTVFVGGAVVLLLLVMSSISRGQIYASQDGHLLDANPRVGSMGLNPDARLDALVPRVNNNLYITGNMTGGSSFQGIVPYRSPMEFQGSLGSSELSDFRRDSVGLDNLSSPIPSRQPFLDFSRSLTEIRHQQVVNSNNLLGPTRVASSPFSVQLNQQANQTTAIRPMEQPNFSLNVSQPRQFNPFKPLGETSKKPEWFEGRTADLLQGKTPGVPSGELIQPLTPGQGILGLGQGQKVQPSDLRVQSIQPLTNEQDMNQSSSPLLPNENQDQNGQNSLNEQELLNALGADGLGERNIQYVQPIVPAPVGETEQGTHTTSGEGTNEFPGIPTAGINTSQPGTGTIKEESDQTKPSPITDLLPESSNVLTQENPLQQEKPSYWPKPLQPKLPYAGTATSTRIGARESTYQRNFEARSHRMFQINMQKGDELLHEGKYYRAADAYGSAIVYDYSSAAAHQGKAHALFGAGEYMSSAYFLYQALTLDPKLAKIRIDLRKLFTNEKQFQSRLKELNDWQTKSKAAELKFLQGYVLYEIGSREQAKTLLTDALALNPRMTAIRPLLHAIAVEKK